MCVFSLLQVIVCPKCAPTVFAPNTVAPSVTQVCPKCASSNFVPQVCPKCFKFTQTVLQIIFSLHCAPSVPQVCPQVCPSCAPTLFAPSVPQVTFCPNCARTVSQLCPKCAPGNSILCPRCAPSVPS